MPSPVRSPSVWWVTGGLLVLSGILHHYTYYSRAAATGSIRPLARSLSELPIRISDYRLEADLPLSAEVLQVSDVDAYVYRRYSQSPSQPPVLFYAGYWGRTNVGMGHGPEICFPAAGWTEDAGPSTRTIQAKIRKESAEVEVAIHHFSRVEPEGVQRVCVAFAAVIDGEFRPSSRGVFLHRPATMDDAFLAQIHAATPVPDGNREAAEERVLSFFEAALPEVSDCLWTSNGHHEAEH